MCEICRQPKCPSACPNADDPVVATCRCCGDYIYASEPILIINQTKCYHRDCLDGMSIDHLLHELGVPFETEFIK